MHQFIISLHSRPAEAEESHRTGQDEQGNACYTTHLHRKHQPRTTFSNRDLFLVFCLRVNAASDRELPLRPNLFARPKAVPLFESPKILRVSHCSTPETTDISILCINMLERINSTQADQNGWTEIGQAWPSYDGHQPMAGSEMAVTSRISKSIDVY